MCTICFLFSVASTYQSTIGHLVSKQKTFSGPTNRLQLMTETLQSILDSEARLISEAAEALPHQFNRCTYTLGYIRQPVYLCFTCAQPRGICGACSIACHTDHEQVELFPKRHFRCDCPTTSLERDCNLHKTCELENSENVYGQNFRGNFCRCGRPYDAAKEQETMIQCLACEVGVLVLLLPNFIASNFIFFSYPS